MSDFLGWKPPEQNWVKLPHEFWDYVDLFQSQAEVLVVLYVLRHTWGFMNSDGSCDQYKKITLDEFENGRKRRDGSRMDKGIGMSKPSIIQGIRSAIEHGFLFEFVDDSDKARVKKYYSLTERGLTPIADKFRCKESLPPDIGGTGVKDLYIGGKDSLHRSEKETDKKETNLLTTLEPNGSSSSGIPLVIPEKKEKKNDKAGPSGRAEPGAAARQPPRPPRRKLTPQQAMLGALCRVFQVDASLNGARYGRLARDLLNLGYTPLQVEVWFSPEDRVEELRRYEGDAVDVIENHSWYYKRHWAWLTKASIPNEALLRQSIQHASVGHEYEIWGKENGDSEGILSVEEQQDFIKSMMQGE